MAEATLEAQLEELLDQETFSPAGEFASHAVISDPDIHERQSGAGVPPGFADAIGWVGAAGPDEEPGWHVTEDGSVRRGYPPRRSRPFRHRGGRHGHR